MLFKTKKKKDALFPYDATLHSAVILSSICTGERTIGFQDKTTKKFHPVCKITTQKDIDAFAKDYNIASNSIKTIY